LSKNKKVLWSEKIIDKYIEEWNWGDLSENITLPWSDYFINKFEKFWKWEKLSGNPNLPWCYDLLKKYEKLWRWKPEDYLGYSSEHTTKYYSSISTNYGIFWDEYMFLEWQDKIDFWRISWVGKIKDSCIRRFFYEFCRRELIGWKHHKYSDDWGHAEVYRTGWENFVLNKNFVISPENIDFYYQTKITLTYPVGNFAVSENYESSDYCLLEILKNKPLKGFTIDEIYDNYDYAKYLFNSEFINDSLWETMVKPIFTEDKIVEYLEYLANRQKKS
jgi:hypothetical protein